jgi:hypothetical protein
MKEEEKQLKKRMMEANCVFSGLPAGGSKSMRKPLFRAISRKI